MKTSMICDRFMNDLMKANIPWDAEDYEAIKALYESLQGMYNIHLKKQSENENSVYQK